MIDNYPLFILDVEDHAPPECRRMELWKACPKCYPNNDGGMWCKMDCRRRNNAE